MSIGLALLIYENISQWHHQDGNIHHLWPHSPPSQEKQLTIIREQDITERILEHMNEAKAPLGTQRSRQTALGG